MNSVENNFVPYQIALDMKSIGFDEPCFGRFDGRGKHKGKIWYEMPNTGQDSIPVGDVLAPLYQQAFRWFREKCLLEGIVEQADDFYWYKFSVYFYGKEGKQKISNGLEFKTYEEAELECLNKLIEIVKQK